MSDPTSPADPKPADPKPADQAATAADAGADTAEFAAVPPAEPAATGTAATGPAATGQGAAGLDAASQVTGGVRTAPAPDAQQKSAAKKGLRRFRLSGAWLTVGGALVLLLVLAVLGYAWGLGPLNRLNTNRGITPPAKLSGLERITDKQIRDQLQLDQTREALSRINNGKQATVEAYGTLDGNRMYVIIALRGKVDIDKTVADSGATPDKIKHVGSSTCVEASGNLPTQCYRGSNTLTVIAQSANEGVTVDQVEPVAEEAYKAMR